MGRLSKTFQLFKKETNSVTQFHDSLFDPKNFKLNSLKITFDEALNDFDLITNKDILLVYIKKPSAQKQLNV